jgi:hypothetical protein
VSGPYVNLTPDNNVTVDIGSNNNKEMVITSQRVDIGANAVVLSGNNITKSIGTNFASNMIFATSSHYTLPAASGYADGTEKRVINTSSSTHIVLSFNSGNSTIVSEESGVDFISYGSKWYLLW